MMDDKKKQDKKKQTVTIDNVEYNLEDLSDNAKAQLANINFVDSRIQHLNSEWAVADTAKRGYSRALDAELNKNGSNQ